MHDLAIRIQAIILLGLALWLLTVLLILQQMNRSDQQLSEGFQSNETIIEEGTHATATAFTHRPTDFAPRAILRSRVHRKLPEEVITPFQNIHDIQSIAIPSRTTHEISQTQTPFHFYQANKHAFRLVYSKHDQLTIFSDKEEDFTSRQMPLKHLLRYQEQNFTLLRPYQQAPFASASKDHLIFDSKFECGNLLCAFQSLSSPQEYHLFMENDTNRFGYNQWFYFAVRTAVSNTYRFRVVNFRKASSFFKLGMKPLIFSLQQHTNTGNGWSRQGQNITYGLSPVHDVLEGAEYKLYCLAFDLELTEDDFTTVSSGLPYSYSRLTRQMSELKTVGQKNGLEWSQRTIAYTLSNNQVPYLIIRNAEASIKHNARSKKKKQCSQGIEEGKPIILILARQHPGETHSSFIMEEILRELANMTCRQSRALLEQYEFHVFPMVNVDGVIYGNFRCDLAGFDLNRTWRSAVKELQPQVYAIGEKIKQLSESQRVVFCLDLHSHSKQYGIFSYCCKEDEVQARVFPHMLSENSHIFMFPACTFGLSRDKFTTARATIASILKHPNVLTVQASAFAFKFRNTLTVLQPLHFKTFSQSILETLWHYLNGGQLRRESEAEVKARLIEFQAYEGKEEEISGSDSECDEDPQEHLKSLQKLLPQNTLKKLEGKCCEVEQQRKSFIKKHPPSLRCSSKLIIVPDAMHMQKVEKAEVKERVRNFPKVDARKQQVLAILRSKDVPKDQAYRRVEEQPVIRMPVSSFKVNLSRYEQNKTENTSQKEELLSEEEARLLEHPERVKKNRSSLIIGSAHREALKAARSKAEVSRFKQRSFDEDSIDTFEAVGDRRNMRRLSKVEKILRLRKRVNTLKNILAQERKLPGQMVELKVGDPEPIRVDRTPQPPSRPDPARLKFNKSSTAINRVMMPAEKQRRTRVALTNHPNAQTSLIGQLWRINYGRYSKELS